MAPAAPVAPPGAVVLVAPPPGAMAGPTGAAASSSSRIRAEVADEIIRQRMTRENLLLS